jgi:type IV secretion system protein VirB10
MNDEPHEHEADEEEDTHQKATAQDYLPPTNMDVRRGNQTRAKIITGSIMACAMLVFGVLGGLRFAAKQGEQAQAAAYMTPRPGAPAPAGTVYDTGATPFPVQTMRSQFSVHSDPQTPSPDEQARTQAILEQQQRAREAAILEQQRALAAQQQSVPPLAASTPSVPQTPTHGEFPIAPPPGTQTQPPAMSSSEQAQQTAFHAPAQPAAQNIQTLAADHREAFIQQTAEDNGIGYATPSTKDTLLPTTVISARLISAIDSDLPGPVSAMVTQPVYDSATHAHVVIPQGAFLYGTYDSHIISGQNRLLVAWTEIIFPNGEDFRMGAQPGTDPQGRSGFSGSVNNHSGDLFRTAFLMTLLGAGEALLAPPPQSVLQQPSIGQVAAQNAGGQLAQVGNQIVAQKVQRPPTITIEPPYAFQVFVTRQLPLQAYAVR